MALWQYLGAGSWTTKLLVHLNWDATDSSWNWNNWTPTNIIWTWWIVWSWSASFNGSNSYIKTSSINIVWWQPNISVVCWLYINSSWEYHFIWQDNISTRIWQIQTTTNNWLNAVVFTDNSNSSYSSTINNVLTTNKRYCIWFTRNSNWNIIIYVNWVPATLAWSNTLSWNINNASLGLEIWRRDYWPQPFYLNWKLDEVIIENRLWSATEFKKHYTASKWRFIL